MVAKEAAKARNGMSNIEQLILDTVLNDFEETIEDFDDLPQGLIHYGCLEITRFLKAIGSSKFRLFWKPVKIIGS
ncbi:MAG: hypothetical protein IPM78_10320 [Moraxellaceae bacterium]|nr:hypothetical protein [Moraxellaceae bacterium]